MTVRKSAAAITQAVISVSGLVALLVLAPTINAQNTRYEGSATNRGYAAQPTAGGGTAALRWDSETKSADAGTLTVGPPLGGSGEALYRAWADSLVFVSFSAVGDTIVWLGSRMGDELAGEYYIEGGQYAGQGGVWHMTRAAGPPLLANISADSIKLGYFIDVAGGRLSEPREETRYDEPDRRRDRAATP